MPSDIPNTLNIKTRVVNPVNGILLKEIRGKEACQLKSLDR